MKMTKFSLIAALALGGLLICSTAAMAQDNKDASKEGKKRTFPTAQERLDRMTTELKLTDEQKPKVKAVLEDQDKKMKDVAPEDRRTKMRELREESAKKFKEILTPEQYTKWEQMPRGGGGKKGGGKKSDDSK